MSTWQAGSPVRWRPVLGRTGVIVTRLALIPVYRVSDRELVLIDSGAEESPELLAALAARGLRVSAVLNTHLHPDHVANSRALVERDEAEIRADAAEIEDVRPRFAALREDPLEQKWLKFEPDYPIVPIGDGEEVTLSGAAFGVIPTPGHTRGHIAVVTPDGVCCMGDALLSEEVLAASRLPFMEDNVDRAIESMVTLRRTAYPRYIAAHRAVIPRERLPALAEANIRKELDLYALLRRLIDRPVEYEEAITAFMRAAGVEREIMIRRSSMRGSAGTRLSALEQAGEIRIENGMVSPA